MGRTLILTIPYKRARFLQVLGQTGNDRMACEAIGIDEGCLYKFLKRDPVFVDERHRARDKFWTRDNPQLATLAREAYVILMQFHDEEWTTLETIKHPDGSTTEIRKVHRSRRPPVQWAVTNCTPLMSDRPAGEQRRLVEVLESNGDPTRADDLNEVLRLVAGDANGSGTQGLSPGPAEIPEGFEAPQELEPGPPGD